MQTKNEHSEKSTVAEHSANGKPIINIEKTIGNKSDKQRLVCLCKSVRSVRV